MAEQSGKPRKARAPKLLDADGLWNYSIKILSMRALSSSEVREKLRRKAENTPDVDAVLAKLREYGYINDARFAENYASARRDTQGFGRMRVLRDLRTRRVAPALASTAVQEAFEGTDEPAMIQAFLERKFRNVPLGEQLQDPKKLQSAYRRLRYAGFSSAASIRVLKRYAVEAERLEESPEDE
jgi:regulatory protein